MKVKKRTKSKSSHTPAKKDSFSMYFSLLRPAMGVFLFFFLTSFIYHYASIPQTGTAVLGVQTPSLPFWESIVLFFVQLFR